MKFPHAFLLLILPLLADPVPETKPERRIVEGAEEAEVKKADEKPEGPIRLDGLWEIHVGGKNTGVELSIRQITERFHATFSKPPKNNPYNIQVGDDFFWGTLAGQGGDGNIFLVGDPEKEGGAPKREQAPAQFRVNNAVDQIRVQVDKENLNSAMKRFELIRVGKVESLRLYVNGPGSLQATANILEDQHMVVEVKHTNPRPHPVEVTLRSGERSITLTAKPLGPDENGIARPGLLRTEPFMPTFGGALGVVKAKEEDQASPAGSEPAAEDWAKVVGTWRVIYKDGALGNVTGWVNFDKYGRCELRYEQPGEGSLREMKLLSARIDGEIKEGDAPAFPKFKLRFGGQGVTSEMVEKPELPEAQRFMLDSQTPSPITLKAEDFEAEVELVFRDGADYRMVNLELEEVLPGGSLMWNWNYRADRTTGRDAEGLGRAGTLLRAPGENESTAAIATGREVWMRDGPAILAAFCTDDQVAMEDTEFYGKPVAKYRLVDMTHETVTKKNGQREVFENRMGPSGNLNRHVFIVAKNLPPASEGKPFPDIRIGEGSGVEEYRIRERGTETNPGNSEELKKAWIAYREAQKVSSSLSDEEAEGEIEGLLVLAIIKNRSEPGPQPFVLAESEGNWNLLYGDVRGKFMIARQLAPSTAAEGDLPADDGEWEPVASAFAPERLHLVVDLKHSREAIKSLKATLAVNNKIVPYGENPDSPAPIVLTPDPNQPTIYRSPPIHLVRAGNVNNPERSEGDLVLEVKQGDVLKAMVQADSGYFINPADAEAKVETSPSELNAHWKDAVKKAADLAGQPVEDWDHVLNGTAGSVTNFIFTEFVMDVAMSLTLQREIEAIVDYARGNKVVIPMSKNGVRSLKISVGDHAAMLLLRDEFVRMMNEQHADWSRNGSPAQRRAIYESQRQALASRSSPLSFIKIPIRSLPEYREGPQSLMDRGRLYLSENKTWWLALDNINPLFASAIRKIGGEDVGRVEDPYLYQVFDNEFLAFKTRLNDDAALFEQFQWSAFNHAYGEWGPMMRRTISQSAGIADGDVEGLRKLTGIGFEPVVARLVPKMMKYDADAGAQRANWVPDHLARAHVKSLGVLGKAAKAQEDYSEVDTSVMLAAAAVATIPLGGGGFWSALAAFSVSAADFAYTYHHDVIGNEKRREELEFEVGAGAVLGADRSADKEATILGDLQQAFGVAGSALGLGVDGAALVRAARAVKTATLIEETGRILREVDFADPAALRALPKEDWALLSEAIRRSDELAEAGRFGEIPEEFLQINKNRKSILKALDGSEEFSSEALDLARKRERLLAESDEQPKEVFRDRDFEEADAALGKKIKENKDRVAELQDEGKKIRSRHPEGNPPPRGSDDAKRLDEIDKEVRARNNENGDFAQRRDVISSYRKPEVKVPKRQAEILRGEGLPPTRSDFDDLRGTRNRVRDGRPPEAPEGLEKVNLDAAAERIDDLSRAAKMDVENLALRNPAPGSPDAKALEAARARVDELKAVRMDIDDLSKNLRSDFKAELPARDAALIRGEKSALSEADNAEVVEAIIDAEGDWAKLLKKADGSPDEQLLMQKIHQWRRQKMDEALTESMREVEAMLGLEEGALKPSAFGSTNLTSDYDISINPPAITGHSRGSELAVRRFQEKTRNLLGGRESGAVLDTNVYTDPVYTIFKGSGLEGELAGVTAKQMDTSRQFLFQQMANAKYRTKGQWGKLRERILNGVPETSRKAMGDILDQAEAANHLAKERLGAKLKAQGITDPTPAQSLRANNDLYADTLESIDGYKNMIEGLEKAGKGEIPASGVPLPGFLQKPEMQRALGDAERWMKSGNPETAAKGREILDELKSRAVLNMRNKQGEALYYAAEAYQTEATINHVVKEMQAPPKKVVTAESIMSGKHNLQPPKEPLSPDDYMNSYFENGANLVKELNAKHVLDEFGGTIPGHAYNDKAATKASKYFIRQLDAASMAKLDMNGVKVPGFPEGFTMKELAEATVELESVRSSMSKFKDVLAKHGMTGEQYLERVMKAQEALDTSLIGRSSLPGFANDLRAAENSAETAASKFFREGGGAKRTAETFLRTPVIALGKAALQSRQDYERNHGARLAELDQAANTGRLLTPAQQDERARLRKIAGAQDSLEQAASAARLSGLSPEEIDRMAGIDPASSDPGQARRAAAARIEEAALDRIKSRKVDMGAGVPAKAPASLGVEGDIDAASLRDALGKGGGHAQVMESVPPDSFGSHLAANREVFTKLHAPDGGTSWVRVHGADETRIIADDPLTGQPAAFPPGLFRSLTGGNAVTVVRDPYRNADGAYIEETGDIAVRLPDLAAALPLPDGGLVD